MLYLAQVIAYTGILYIVYMLLLRNRPMHGFNRAYLLSIIVLPVVIPFIKLSSLTSYFEKNTVMNMRLPEVIVGGVYEQQLVSNTINWVLVAYVSVTVLMLALFIRKWILLRKVISRSTAIQEADYTLLLNTNNGPGSWGRYILLPDEQIHETIVQHEAAHVRLYHSRDILLINLVQCLFWPNIFLQAIKKELKQVHEFQADAAVGMDRQQYSELLLSNVFNTCTLPLTHSFNIHPIKRRIMMLKKRSSKPIALTIGLLAVIATSALLFNMVALQSCKAKKWEVYDAKQVDKMAEFNGDLVQFMLKTLRYPKEAIDSNIEGKVSIGFVIDENGKVKDVKVKSKDAQPLLAAEAVRVVSQMPDWIPAEKNGKKVAVEMTQPISFRLPESLPETEYKIGVEQPEQKKTTKVGVNGFPIDIATTRNKPGEQHHEEVLKKAVEIIEKTDGNAANQLQINKAIQDYNKLQEHTLARSEKQIASAIIALEKADNASLSEKSKQDIENAKKVAEGTRAMLQQKKQEMQKKISEEGYKAEQYEKQRNEPE